MSEETHSANNDEDARRHVGFFLVPTFNMLPFIAAVEPLRVANRISGQNLYQWQTISIDGNPVTASNGMVHLTEAEIDAAHALHTVIVCGPFDPYRYREKRVFAWLRGLSRSGAEIGALETGSYLLARAGLLGGYRCTIHWENMPGFIEEFPQLAVSHELYELDRKRFTCSGGIAALDMMLHLIERDQGRALASEVAEQFMHNHIRDGHAPQRTELRSRIGVSQPKLLECIALMEANLEEPLAPSELGERVGVSKRQLERLFRRYLGTTLARYYMELRLKRSRHLLEQTSLAVTEVAMACGFSSPGHFSARYRTLFGLTPREERGIR